MRSLLPHHPEALSYSIEGEVYQVVNGAITVAESHVKALVAMGCKVLDRVSVDQGKRDPDAAAAKAISDTPAVVTKANAPVAKADAKPARGAAKAADPKAGEQDPLA